MNYKNRLKAAVTQTLLRALLEDAGYRIIPLGIEEVVREVRAVDVKTYQGLNLSPNLRCLPDFFVADKELANHWMVEVKYRKQWNDETKQRLEEQISEQVGAWQPIYLTVFLGESTNPDAADTPARWLRVIKLLKDEKGLYTTLRFTLDGKPGVKRFEWSELTWNDFRRFQDVFPAVGKNWENQTIAKSVSLLTPLRELDLFED